MTEIDAGLIDAARESVNFGSLVTIEPLLAIYGAGAESGVYSDPNGSLVKCRQFGEVLAEQLVRRSGTRFDGSKQIDRIQALERAGVLTRPAADTLHEIRKIGNEATHSHLFNVRAALQSVERCWRLGDMLRLALLGDQTPRSFVAPQPVTPPPTTSEADRAELDTINRMLAQSRTELTETLTALDATRSAKEAEAEARRAAEDELERIRQREEVVSTALAALRQQLAALQGSGVLASTEPAKVTTAAGNTFSKAFRRRRPLNEVHGIGDRQTVESGVLRNLSELAQLRGVDHRTRQRPLHHSTTSLPGRLKLRRRLYCLAVQNRSEILMAGTHCRGTSARCRAVRVRRIPDSEMSCHAVETTAWHDLRTGPGEGVDPRS